MDAVTESPLKAVAIQEGHEELKVFFFAVVGSRRHEQEVPRQSRELLPQSVTFRCLYFPRKERSGHFVGFVHHDKVPIRLFEFRLDVFVAAQFVEPANGQGGFQKPVARPSGFELFVGQDVKGQMELEMKLVLPLLGKHSGTHNKAAVQVATGQEFLNEKAGHDCLASAWVVSQQKA